MDQHCFPGPYPSIPRYLRHLRGPLTPAPAGITQTAPDEEPQVDHPEGPMPPPPATGQHLRPPT